MPALQQDALSPIHKLDLPLLHCSSPKCHPSSWELLSPKKRQEPTPKLSITQLLLHMGDSLHLIPPKPGENNSTGLGAVSRRWGELPRALWPSPWPGGQFAQVRGDLQGRGLHIHPPQPLPRGLSLPLFPFCTDPSARVSLLCTVQQLSLFCLTREN